MNPVKIGILTASDRAQAGIYPDRSGPAIADWFQSHLQTPWTPVSRLVADDSTAIAQTLIALCDGEGCGLVVTTGGTGPAPRDVTPEATAAVCDKMLPGFGELMRAVSLREVPTAILSRQTAGVRGRSLILNLPGKPTSIATCLAAVFPAVPYCLDLIGGPHLATDPAVMVCFRPPT